MFRYALTVADYSREEVPLGTDVHYTVPTGHFGADWNEVLLAIRKAVEEYQEMYADRLHGHEPYDDAIKVFGNEEEIVIKFHMRPNST